MAASVRSTGRRTRFKLSISGISCRSFACPNQSGDALGENTFVPRIFSKFRSVALTFGGFGEGPGAQLSGHPPIATLKAPSPTVFQNESRRSPMSLRAEVFAVETRLQTMLTSAGRRPSVDRVTGTSLV